MCLPLIPSDEKILILLSMADIVTPIRKITVSIWFTIKFNHPFRSYNATN